MSTLISRPETLHARDSWKRSRDVTRWMLGNQKIIVSSAQIFAFKKSKVRVEIFLCVIQMLLFLLSNIMLDVALFLHSFFMDKQDGMCFFLFRTEGEKLYCGHFFRTSAPRLSRIRANFGVWWYLVCKLRCWFQRWTQRRWGMQKLFYARIAILNQQKFIFRWKMSIDPFSPPIFYGKHFYGAIFFRIC